MNLDAAYITDWGSAAVRLAIPLILATVGGMYSERSGVFNIGIEGMMLTGAFTAVAVAYTLSDVSPPLASLVAAVAAMLTAGGIAAIHGYMAITRRADQIISGVAINILALGLTNTLFRVVWGRSGRSRVAGFPEVKIPGLSDIPVIGRIFFQQSIIVYVAVAIVAASWFVLFRTTWGLNLRATGEQPVAVDTAGVSVVRVRYLAVLFSGLMSGLAGAALALGAVRYFTPGMTAGRGFIVLAAIVLGRWNPVWGATACLLFGAADAFQLRAQVMNLGVPYQFFVMLPYVLAVLAMALGRARPPQSLGLSYQRGVN